jgi:L-alanine-DL-glutamate epimerase-like enolase superfamily enzyme
MRQLTWQPYTVQLRTTWRIAHGSTNQRHNVLVDIGGGQGEGAGVPHHGESQAGIIAYLEQLGQRDWDPYQIEDQLNALPHGSKSAQAAIDMALHDLLGQQLGQPLYRILGLNPQKIPETSFTVSMDEPAVMAERARQSNLPIIKIKLGSPDDEAIVSAIRQATPARLRVDANAGWSREKALQMIPRLVQYDLEFIEQPLPVGDIEGLRWLRAQLRAQGVQIPIFADENIKTAQDVAEHAGAVDGVVIKLMKTGGIRAALRAIHTARAHGMQIMIGCMVETTLGVTAAAHIAALCDYADLDGPLLIANDPCQGVTYEGARLILPDAPGLGVQAL